MAINPDETAELVDAIQDMGAALNNFSAVLKRCREAGMTQLDMRDAILSQIPEEDHPAFLQQWPFLSMMLSSL